MNAITSKSAGGGSSFGGKILFVVTKSNWGGAQAYVYALATHFKDAGADVAVVLGGTGEADAKIGLLAEKLAASGVRTIVVKSFMRDISLVREFTALAELVRIFRNERPDIVHLNSSKAGGIGALAARLAGVPRIIFTSHGLAYDEDRPFVARVLIWLATWVTFCLAHQNIVISRDNFERARRFPGCSHKVVLIYNGIAPISLRTRKDARAKLGLPSEGIAIGTIAEFVKNKALSSLIEAMKLLARRGHTLTLSIIGTEGDERPALEALIHTYKLHDTVRLLGFVPNAATYLAAFDIFTLVSIKEGLPTVLLEAGDARCAVVGTRIPGIVNIVENNVSGLLVEPERPADIAQALERLIGDAKLRARLGNALHERVHSLFSQEKMLSDTKALYER